MKFLSFNYQKTCLLDQENLKKIGQAVFHEVERLRGARNYDSDYAAINLPGDSAMVGRVQSVIKEKQELRPTMLVVIGIGGSHLGAKAIHEALFGHLYNEQKPEVKLYWADTVDSDYILDILLLVEQELQRGNNILLNVISKSGTTTETVANFEIFLSLLKKARKDMYRDCIVVTTDRGSALWNVAQQERFACLEIPKKVGGRFSVFSPVGLFPLGFLGVDIKELLRGARETVALCVDDDIFKNPAALSAAMAYQHYMNGKSIYDLFLFSVDLKSIGAWYRQLVAESLGKKFNRDGGEVRIGIMPTVSIGSTDLHSMVQLYLGGPRNRFTLFVSAGQNKSELSVPHLKEYEQCVASIQGKSLSSILNAILYGVQEAYSTNELPFYSVEMPKKSALYVGQFLQWKMIEIIYLGYLLDVNPFDQPQVELYKQETRKILAHE